MSDPGDLSFDLPPEVTNGLATIRCGHLASGHLVTLHRIDAETIRHWAVPSFWFALSHSAFQARAILGGLPSWLVSVQSSGGHTAWLFVHLRRGRLRAEATVTMVGSALASNEVWPVVDAVAARLAATSMQVESVASEPTGRIPAITGEVSRFTGERLYVVDLRQTGGLQDRFSKNTKRNVAKATRSGLTLDVRTEKASFLRHLELTNASMERRGRRGEDVSQRASNERMEMLLASGCGQVFQAVDGSETLSSDFVFRCGPCAYYYDGGSSPEGMAVGSSHYLMASMLERLCEEGSAAVNLGLARTGNDGLARFKEGFGARLTYVERVTVDRTTLGRMLRNLVARWLR